MVLNKYKQIDVSLILNYLIITYAFCIPISRAGISITLTLLTLFWILEGNFKNKIKLLISNNVIVAIIIFLGFNFISLFWTENVMESLNYIRRYWYLLPMLVIFTSLKKEYIPIVITAFISAMFISEVISYGVFFELWTYNSAIPANPSPFMHHIEYSVFLAFSALLLLSRIFNDGNLKSKVVYIFFFLTMTGNLFLTAGRTGQVGFILGLFVLTLLSFKNKIKAFMISMSIAILLLGAAFNLSTTFHERVYMAQSNVTNVIKNNNYCSSLGARIGAYIASKDIILSHPIGGIGIIDNMNAFRNLVDEKYPDMGCIKELPHMHNQYLQVLTQLGIIGLVLFLIIFYCIAYIPLRINEYKNIKYVYLTVLLTALVPEVLLHRAFSLTLFALIIGILLAQSRIENEI